MNPGFLSYILLTLSLIVIVFGFRQPAIGDGSTRAAMWFGFAWIAAAAFEWRIDAWSGTLTYVPLLALAAFALIEPYSAKDAATALSFACLVGAIYSLIQLVERIDPLAIAVHPEIDPVVLCAVLIACYTRRASLQLALLSIALVVNDAYMALLYASFRPAYFGGREFQDAWWLSAVSLRAITVSAVAAFAMVRRESGRIRGWLRVRR